MACLLATCAPTAVKQDRGVSERHAPEVRPTPQTSPEHAPKLERSDFNRLAALLDRPLFWEKDLRNPGVLNPEELAILGVGADRSVFVDDSNGIFTPNFTRIYRAMVERRRREAVARELEQGRTTLVRTDLASEPEYRKAVVRHITRAARIVEELYALQKGSHHLRDCPVPGDESSYALIRRNQGPWCQAPATEEDPFCHACPDYPSQRSGLYPAHLAEDPAMCKKLAARGDADQLLAPFVVVRGAGDSLRAVPYHRVWAHRTRRVAGQLRAAAAALPQGEEQTFRAYLLAAATGFETNDWGPVDEAWVAMTGENSKWYLRIGPDEVYSDPCNRKAAFHVSFGRVDPVSLGWSKKLTPHRDEMEQGLARLIGPSYSARKVRFHLPDFIEIILNAGDSRLSLGAFIGQSLPNWGRVAVEGRRRTVVMSNLYSDTDSVTIRRKQAASLFSKDSMKHFTTEKKIALLGTVLHEATHNLGPHSDYRIDGKNPRAVFGGTTATVLEELKSQTGSIYYLDFLRKKGILDPEEVRKAQTCAVVWCFGQISRGMFTPSGRAKPYGQVAAIQLAFLVREGALSWDSSQMAANGKDRGRFTIHHHRMASAAEKLMRRVGRILARGDAKDAEKWIVDEVSGDGSQLVGNPAISNRMLRYPKASFTYSVTF
jgi:hypothetical protein